MLTAAAKTAAATKAPTARSPARPWRVRNRYGIKMIGVTLMAAASPTRTPRGRGRSIVRSATIMSARMMLTWPSRKVWRTGSNSTTGSTRASPHHRMVRFSSVAHTARRLTTIRANSAARFSHEKATSQARSGKWANGAKSSAENGG